MTSSALLPIPTSAEWSIASAQSQEEHETSWSAYARFHNVKMELFALHEAGNLPTGIIAMTFDQGQYI